MVGFNTQAVYEYSLTTPYDLSTTSYTGTAFDVSGEDTSPQAIAWNGDGTALYMSGDNTSTVYQYDITPDLTRGGAQLSQSKSLGYTPSRAVVTDDRTGSLTVTYEIVDGSGNTVTVSDAQVGEQVDTSALADGDVTVTATLNSPSPSSADTLESYAVYFNR